MSNKNPRMIKTPILGITIGEAYVSSDGHYGLHIKRPKGSEYEDLPLDQLFAMVVARAMEQRANE